MESLEARELGRQLLALVRPHASDEDLSFLEGAEAAEAWTSLVEMCTSLAKELGLEISEHRAV